MRMKVFRRCLAVFCAAVLSVGSLAAMPAAAETKNLITNSTFDSGTTGWGTYQASGGSATLSAQNGKLALQINSVGKLNYSVQCNYDVIPLYKNGVYHVSYEISSTTDRYVEAMIQQNGGTYQAYTWKGIDLTSEPQTIDYEFTMKQDTDIMSKLVFNCGLENGEDLDPHTIYLDNVKVELVDDSKVEYDDILPYAPSIITDQVGYQPEETKTAVFRDVTNETSFSVVNQDSGKVVYTGELSASKFNSMANETDWTGDFSAITEPGTYYITCGGLDQSYAFTIGEDVYNGLLDDTVRMLYLQRCGTEIEDDTFGHAACHNTLATVYHTSDKIDVSGGWHDAGDYGRYVVPGAKSVADLLIAYGQNPGMFSDSIGIPESGNGVPDVLDEARYELEWMLKMQDSETGGVHHKVSCENFPGYVMPENETDELIVTPVSTTATADVCAAMAMAYEYYQNVDQTFAETCLDAAKKAWAFLEKNPNFIFSNPSDITTGDYGDSFDTDERYWAAAQMWRATGEETYRSALEKMSVQTGMDWMEMGDYGNFAILTMKGVDTDSTIYTRAKRSILQSADKAKSLAQNDAYGVSVAKYNWGSNMGVATSGMILNLAYQLTEDSSYLETSRSNLHYLLGSNAVGECFVTGYGTVSPEHPHHRPSMAKNQAMKGMLVGGVNSGLEDSAAKAYCANSPAAKCYVDNWESYSTNEITIYWNSPLTCLLAMSGKHSADTPEEDILPGDVNLDKAVNTADIVLLQKYLLGAETLTKAQAKNADVLADETVNGFDLTVLRQMLTEQNDDSDKGNEPSSDADVLADFRKGATSLFEASDGWTNGNPFDCGWTKNNTSFDNGVLNLTIDKDTSGKYNYTGAEYRSTDHYGYGYYETSMKAIKNDGVVSSFFTYTGPSESNPWDEIDVEVLGKDTTKVQFNYYTNGTGNHEYLYDLGFDASEGYHTYGFDWQKDSITWYVDGKAVYTATSNIPVTPGKIMMNVWPGIGVNDWLKPFDGTTPLTASYEWVTYQKASKAN